MTNNTLFYSINRIETVFNDGNQLLRNMTMKQSDIILYKNVMNTIEFNVKNLDRKPIPLMGITLQLNVFDPYGQQILVNKPLHVVNEQKGLVLLQMQPWETMDWPLGFLKYSVLMVNHVGSHLLMLDRDQGTVGILELKQAATLPQWKESVKVDQFTPVLEDTTRWYSSALEGSLRANNRTGLHTIAVYTETYTGKLWVQGSICDGVPMELDWFDLDLSPNTPYHIFSNHTGIETFNINAPLQWLRFSHKPTTTESKLKQILLRN